MPTRTFAVLLALVLPPFAVSQPAPTGAPAPAVVAAPVPAALVAPDVPAAADASRDAALRVRAEGLVDAFTNSGGLFTRDGKRVVFVSSRSGLPQPYVAELGAPSSEARRLFTWPERVVLDMTTPDGKAVLIRSDHGAEENWSIYRAPLDGGPPVEITAGEKMQRDNAYVADLAPQAVYFSGRKMEDASSAIFVVPMAGGPSREIFRDPKPFGLVDVSRDGTQLMVARFPTLSDNQVLLVDAATGASRQLYPPKGGRAVVIHACTFSPDSKTAYVATDLGGEQTVILALDAATGAERARYAEPGRPAGIDTLVATRTGDALVVGLDRGDENAVRLLDARTLRPGPSVKLPLGAGAVTDVSVDGRRALLDWSTPATPRDLWLLEVRTGAVTRARDERRPTLAGLPAMETSITAVKAHDGLMLPVNLTLPRNAKGKLPVIVSYHGGPSSASKVRWSAMTAFFVSLGYAWVEPNVRGSGGFGRSFEEADNGRGRLEAFKDIETTGRWAASQPWADPSRVVVFGGSYGGYTVLTGLTRTPDLWRAGVDLFGVASLPSFMATTSGLIREIFLVEFGDPDKDAAFLESISPLRDAGKIVAPLFVYAGANHPRVPRSESDLIVAALRARGVPVEYMVAENEGHSLARRENLTEFMARSARFLERHAGPAAAPPR